MALSLAGDMRCVSLICKSRHYLERLEKGPLAIITPEENYKWGNK